MFAIAATPWLAGAPPTPLQLAVSAIFLGICLGLLSMGLPRRYRAELRVRGGEVRVGGAPHAVGPGAYWQLRLAPNRLAPQCKYACDLVLERGVSFELLSGPRPDRVLRDLHQCLRVLPLPVRTGWGLRGDATPWSYSGGSAGQRPATSSRLRIVAERTDPRLSRVALGMTLVTAGLMGWLTARQAASLGSTMHPVSWLLPSALVASLCFIAFAASAKSQLLANERSVRLLGGILGRACGTASRAGVRGATIVGRSPDKTVCHLLLETDDGPLASRVRTDRAEELERRVIEGLGLPPG